ncbi:hypothetical protein NYQ10_08100 [Flavobacterium johnsoniae]|uniref:hypothetical protein n=1 Tax=Flavobacterium johnsoniae TaxID=986 RepID=UPI0025B14BA1|nr:hypothetical protein [Flavobacterium johnsoniae]WJS96413.1 hypothetical protein NYQ10_08100 [Flavobacterium johnsoniae]
MTKRILLFLFFVFLAHKSTSQEIEPLSPIQKKLYDFETVQVKPEFNGGKDKFTAYILENFKKTKAGKNFKGSISLNFIVEIDGSLTNIVFNKKIENKVKQDLKNVILKSPKWLCGEHEGYHVRTKVDFTIDII